MIETVDDEDVKNTKILKGVHEDKLATINGRDYKIAQFNHRKRSKVWAYFSSISPLMELGNFNFMDTPKFREIETLIFENTLFEGSKLSATHFETYPQDYIRYVTTMMGAISYPFFAASPTG